MFGRENAIGIVLLLICAGSAVVLLSGIVTGTRFTFVGPAWLETVLVIVFLAASAGVVWTRPGRRWPWDRNRD